MALWLYGSISGVHGVFTNTYGSAIASGLVSNAALRPTIGFYSTTDMYTRMAYDLWEDAVLITHNRIQSPDRIQPLFYSALYNSQATSQSFAGYPDTILALNGATLSPAGSAGVGTISARGASIYRMPLEGGCTGITYDPNTESIYQSYWTWITNTLRAGGVTVPYAYGQTRFFSVYVSNYSPGWEQLVWDGVVNGEDTVFSNVYNTASPGFAGRMWRLLGHPGFPPSLPPVIFDDITITAYGDPSFGVSWIGCWKRDASAASSNFRSLYRMPFGWPMGIAPYGVDRCIAVWWAYPQYGAPLVYSIHRYDRTNDVLVVEDTGLVPTSRIYRYPDHMGYVTYDLRRGHLLLLSENPNTIDQFTVQNYCHPGNPLSATAAVPLTPAHAGLSQKFIAATMTGTTIIGSPQIGVSYVGFQASNFTRTTQQFATAGVNGQGTFAVSWASTVTQSGAFILTMSTFSVGLSATYSYGTLYGTQGMALLTSTASFTVSTTLVFNVGTTVTTGVTILPRIPVSQADTIGIGSPRLLSYPTASIASPYFYAMNPPVYTNILAQPFTRPLYGSQRTLTQTTHVQFTGDVTDLIVEETWPGGGNRIAMPLSQFAALYEMYMNPPDFASAGFITWEPRDITARKYQVLITNVTAGGSDGIELNNLAKTGDGYVAAEVKMTLRIIGEV